MTLLKRLFQESDVILYFVFLWQLPFSWRHIFIESRGISSDRFNEYMDVSLYVGEVILIFSAILYIINNINLVKSIFIKNIGWLKRKFHVEQVMFLSIILFFALNTVFSIDPVLSMTFTWHALLVGLFSFLTYQFFVPRGIVFLRDVLTVFTVSLFIQFIIAGYQVLISHGIGLTFLNESKISVENIHVAKSEIFNQKVLRGYGTFPHPNILSAYSVTVYAFFLYCKNLFHVEQKFKISITAITVLVILLTGSKSGILLFFMIHFFDQIRTLFHVKQIVIFSTLVLFVVTLIYQNDLQKSFFTRVEQFTYQSKFSQNTFFGTGIGTYRYSYENESGQENWWLLEPVHSVPYIIYREAGVFGSGLILVVALYMYRLVPRGTSSRVYLTMIPILFFISTDHFMWDIQQGMYLFSILAFILFNSIDKNIYKLFNI